MEAFFRTVAIGLGVLMGTFQPGTDPGLEVSVRRAGTELTVSGTLVRAVGPALTEALDEGVPLALTFEAWVGDRPAAPAVQVLAGRPLTGEWVVTGPGETRRVFATRAEAVAAWVTWEGLPAGVPPAGAFEVRAQVRLSFPDRPEWKADMVWKEPAVGWRKAYRQLSEIPF